MPAAAPNLRDSPSLADLALDWHLHPGLTGALVAAGACYLVGTGRASRPGHPWPRGRAAAFLAGLAVVALCLQGGLDTHADDLLSVHMVQHLLLTLVAPPLLLLGAPVTLALRALPPAQRAALAAVVTGRLARTIAHPLVAWSLFAAVLLSTHLSPLYDAALRNEPLHGLEHFLYLGSALVFWLPLVDGDPAPRPRQPALRMLYLLLAMPPMALVGVTLVAGASVRYPAYVEPAAALGRSALADQHAAGAIMWVGGSLALVAATLLVGWSALAREERRAVAAEGYADRRLEATGSERR